MCNICNPFFVAFEKEVVDHLLESFAEITSILLLCKKFMVMWDTVTEEAFSLSPGELGVKLPGTGNPRV